MIEGREDGRLYSDGKTEGNKSDCKEGENEKEYSRVVFERHIIQIAAELLMSLHVNERF